MGSCASHGTQARRWRARQQAQLPCWPAGWPRRCGWHLAAQRAARARSRHGPWGPTWRAPATLLARLQWRAARCGCLRSRAAPRCWRRPRTSWTTLWCRCILRRPCCSLLGEMRLRRGQRRLSRGGGQRWCAGGSHAPARQPCGAGVIYSGPAALFINGPAAVGWVMCALQPVVVALVVIAVVVRVAGLSQPLKGRRGREGETQRLLLSCRCIFIYIHACHKSWMSFVLMSHTSYSRCACTCRQLSACHAPITACMGCWDCIAAVSLQ